MKRLQFEYGGAGGFYIIPTVMVNEYKSEGISFLFLKWHLSMFLRSKKYLTNRKILEDYGKRYANSRPKNNYIRTKDITGFDLIKYCDSKRKKAWGSAV